MRASFGTGGRGRASVGDVAALAAAVVGTGGCAAVAAGDQPGVGTVFLFVAFAAVGLLRAYRDG